MHSLIGFCRFCLCFEGDFNNMSTGDIIEKANACIGELEFYLNVPNLICNTCLDTLDMFFNFRNQCLRSELVFHRYIQILTQEQSTEHFLNTKLAVVVPKNIQEQCNVENVRSVIRKAFISIDETNKIHDDIVSHEKHNTASDFLTFNDFSDLEKTPEISESIESDDTVNILESRNSELESKSEKLHNANDINHHVTREVVLNSTVLSNETRNGTPESTSKRTHLQQEILTYQDNFIQNTKTKECSVNKRYKVRKPAICCMFSDYDPQAKSNLTKTCISTCKGQIPAASAEISTDTDYEKDIACYCISSVTKTETKDNKSNHTLQIVDGYIDDPASFNVASNVDIISTDQEQKSQFPIKVVSSNFALLYTNSSSNTTSLHSTSVPYLITNIPSTSRTTEAGVADSVILKEHNYSSKKPKLTQSILKNLLSTVDVVPSKFRLVQRKNKKPYTARNKLLLPITKSIHAPADQPPILLPYYCNDDLPPPTIQNQKQDEATIRKITNEIDSDLSYSAIDEKLNALNETISMDPSFTSNSNCGGSDEYMNTLSGFWSAFN